MQGKQTTPNHKVKVRQAVEEKDWIRVENAHAPLIDPCLFEIVQALLDKDTRTSPKEDSVFPLSGLLYCGDCGQPMVRKTTTYSLKGAGDFPKQKYSYFVCQGQSKGKGCSWHRIREKELLDAVLQAVNHHVKSVLDTRKALKDIDTAPSVQFLIQKYESHIEKKETELQKAEKLKVGIYEDLKDGLLDKTEYRKLKQEFDSRIEAASEAIKNLRQEIFALRENHSQHYAWMEYFKEFGELQELTRWAAAITINRILVFEDNRIKIVFNFEDAFMQAQELLRELEGKEGA